jgi:peroxiredoxin Q/BCP
MIRVGERAPDFTLPSQDGRQVSLSDFRGKANVVIYFYPKDFTAGCTAETMHFGQKYGEIREMGAEVLGISSDTEESHRSFAEKCGAGFTLLSDRGGRVRKLYGVKSTLGVIPGRVTFVVDREGVVRHVFASQFEPKRHVEEAIEALRRMAA